MQVGYSACGKMGTLGDGELYPSKGSPSSLPNHQCSLESFIEVEMMHFTIGMKTIQFFMVFKLSKSKDAVTNIVVI